MGSNCQSGSTGGVGFKRVSLCPCVDQNIHKMGGGGDGEERTCSFSKQVVLSKFQGLGG